MTIPPSSRLIASPLASERGGDAVDVRIVASLDDLPADVLAELSRNRSFYVSPPWLRTVEALRGGGTAYLTATDAGGRIRGVLPVYWGSPSGRGFYSPYDMFLEPSGGRFRREDWSPAYIVGSRTAYDCEFLIDASLGRQAQNAVLAALLGAADAHARSVGAASIAALYLSETGAGQLAQVLPPGRWFFPAAANAVLEPAGPSFDDYARSLGHKRATSIRHERRVFADTGYDVSQHSLAGCVDEIAGLFAALEERHGHDASAEGEAAELRLMAEHAQQRGQVLIARREGRVAGAVLFFLHGDGVYVRQTGFDYTILGKAFEYFNLVYYELIEFALRNGYQHLEYGITAYGAKTARGAALRPLSGIAVSLGADLRPEEDAAFAAWARARQHAISAGDARLLEAAGLV